MKGIILYSIGEHLASQLHAPTYFLKPLDNPRADSTNLQLCASKPQSTGAICVGVWSLNMRLAPHY